MGRRKADAKGCSGPTNADQFAAVLDGVIDGARANDFVRYLVADYINKIAHLRVYGVRMPGIADGLKTLAVCPQIIQSIASRVNEIRGIHNAQNP